MLDPIILDAEQEAAVELMLAQRPGGGALVASETGTGKSVVIVEYVIRSHAQTVLLIVPLQTIGNPLLDGDEYAEGWWGTFDRQVSTIPFRKIDSSKTGMEALADYQWGVPGVFAITKELYTRWAWDILDELDAKGKRKRVRTTTWDLEPDVVIFDEIHWAQNKSGMTFRAMNGNGITHNHGLKAKQLRVGASGTFNGNSFEGAWAVTKWLWPDLIDSSISVWRSRWALTEFDPFAFDKVKVIGERDPGAFTASLPCYIRQEASFNIEVESDEFHVQLTPDQRKVYDDLDDKMVAWLRDNPLVVKFPVVKRARLRQVALGMPTITQVWNVKTEEFDDVVDFEPGCVSPKVDMMWSILEGTGKAQFRNESALIFTDSQKFARVLVGRINARYGAGSAAEYSGKVSKADRNTSKHAFIKGEVKYLVTVIKAGGTGNDLMQFASHNILFFSRDESRIENEQGIARLVRRGQNSVIVRIASIIADDTCDTGQLSKQMQQQLSINQSLKKRARR